MTREPPPPLTRPADIGQEEATCHVVTALREVGIRAAGDGQEGVTCCVVDALRGVGIRAAGGGWGEVTCQVAAALGGIGVLTVGRGLGGATSQVVDSLREIGTLAIGEGLVEVTCLVADALGNVGTLAVGAGQEESACQIIAALEDVGVLTVGRKPGWAPYQVVDPLQEIGAVGRNPEEAIRPVAEAQGDAGLLSTVKKLAVPVFRLAGALKKEYARPFPALIPPDIAVVLLWLAAALLLIFFIQSSAVRVAAALPVILFIPGYLLVGFLFPGKDDLDWTERTALSIVLSVAIVPLLVFALNFTPFGITLGSVAATLTVLILLTAVLAALQRSIVPADERLSFPDGRAALDRWSGLVIRKCPERPYRILLLLSLLLLVAGTIIMVSIPPQGEHYTEFYLLDADHALTDLSYPALPNVSFPLGVAVRNHEYRPINYTVEVMGVNSTLDPLNNMTVIREMESISTFNLTVQQNQTVQAFGTLSFPDSRYNLLQFLLFLGEAPDQSIWGQGRVNQSYRHLDLKARPA